jgi:hypothetical protein
MHTIDPKHEAISLAPSTAYTKIANYSIKMTLSWLSKIYWIIPHYA